MYGCLTVNANNVLNREAHFNDAQGFSSESD